MTEQNRFFTRRRRVLYIPFGAGGKQLGGLAHAGFALPFLLARRVSL